jgi:hypothetical protein
MSCLKADLPGCDFNQKKNLAVDSLQTQRAAKVTTTDDCTEAQPMARVRALDRRETSWY